MTQIFKTYLDFLKRDDKEVNGVSEEFAKQHPDYEADNASNKGCWNCYRCSDCSRCSDWKDNQPQVKMEIPVIKNIHQKVLDAVTDPKHSLEMGCDTTHCRAGWVIHLAGEKGYELERRTDPVFAAMQIYKASSPIRVSPPRFFEHNKTAMADIKALR